MSAATPDEAAVPEDVRRIERACARGVRDALRRIRHLGVPLPVWRDGRVVHVDVDELLRDPGFEGLDDEPARRGP